MLTKINSGLAPTIGARHGIYVPSIQNADLNRADEDHPINQPDTENEPNSGNQQNATNQTNQENQKYLDLWEPCILDNTTYIGAYLVPEACDVESWHNCGNLITLCTINHKNLLKKCFKFFVILQKYLQDDP